MEFRFLTSVDSEFRFRIDISTLNRINLKDDRTLFDKTSKIIEPISFEPLLYSFSCRVYIKTFLFVIFVVDEPHHSIVVRIQLAAVICCLVWYFRVNEIFLAVKRKSNYISMFLFQFSIECFSSELVNS